MWEELIAYFLSLYTEWCDTDRMEIPHPTVFPLFVWFRCRGYVLTEMFHPKAVCLASILRRLGVRSGYRITQRAMWAHKLPSNIISLLSLFWKKNGFMKYPHLCQWERSPLSLVSTIEELLGRKSSCSGLENGDYCRRGSAALTTRHLYIRKSCQ
jgi:hypothetical protein